MNTYDRFRRESDETRQRSSRPEELRDGGSVETPRSYPSMKSILVRHERRFKQAATRARITQRGGHGNCETAMRVARVDHPPTLKRMSHPRAGSQGSRA